jgi:dCTP deaminase
MPVIPWIEETTFVRSQIKFSEGNGVHGSRILISNFDDKQFGEGETNACYDLRVGLRYRDHRKSDVYAVGEEFTLVAGTAVVIETEEEFHFPKTRFGYVVPKVGMLQQGVSNTMSKVDPGYHGPLLITVFNLGQKDVPIKRLDRICALVVHDVDKGIVPYDKPAKQLPGRAPWKLRPGQWLDRLQERTALIALLALIVSIFTLVAQIFKKH